MDVPREVNRFSSCVALQQVSQHQKQTQGSNMPARTVIFADCSLSEGACSSRGDFHGKTLNSASYWRFDVFRGCWHCSLG
eukprot:6368682-Amphidinium_carterae.2